MGNQSRGSKLLLVLPLIGTLVVDYGRFEFYKDYHGYERTIQSYVAQIVDLTNDLLTRRCKQLEKIVIIRNVNR